MGWKVSTIIINHPTAMAHEEILTELGFTHLSKIEDKTFDQVVNPAANTIYIASYKDNLILCTDEMPMEFLAETTSPTEYRFMRLFPQSEICALVLHSSVNLWGYSILKAGEKIRARAGSADDGTLVEYGAPLPEEMELLSKSSLDEDGNRVYDFGNSDEPYSEDQVGEEFVFEIAKRYIGQRLDYDDDLFQITFTGYSYGTKQVKSKPEVAEEKPKKNNLRWVIGAVIGVILYQLFKRCM